jgi:hypothetical protein
MAIRSTGYEPREGAMADKRGYTSGRYLLQISEDFHWIFEGKSDISFKVEPATHTIVISTQGHDAYLPLKKGKLYEAENLLRSLIATRSSGFPPTEAGLRALVQLTDSLH